MLNADKRLVNHALNLVDGDVQMKLSIHVRRVMRDSIRVYFAPLTGAIKGIREELQRADRQIERNRRTENQPKADAVHHA